MASQPALSPRAQRTRTALIAAGFDLLVERPIDAIPIDDVVARAGVAKGSFFNHFADKPAFAEAIATQVRLELEDLVGKANAGVADPVERMAGGMRVCAQFALHQPKRATVLIRSNASSTAQAHPLNQGLLADVAAAAETGQLRSEAAELGVLYWLGLCQVVMAHLLERRRDPDAARARLRAMIVLGLCGLGVTDAHAQDVAARQSDLL
jgi:AcrR family transcriptional regulator